MSTIKRILVIAVASFIPHSYATTYYINSQLGNDFWSGKRPTATSSPSPDGPWQSLNRLAAASLSPGDVVELQCGSKWAQTLRVQNSGTPQLPIIIRSSSPCDVPPSIDGSQSIDAHSWVRHNGAIYKALWPNQKIQNGSLASGIAGWRSWSAAGDQKLIHESSCPDSSDGCAAFTSSLKPGGSLVSSNNFGMEGGVSYSGQLSLRIPAGIRAKVLVRRDSPPYEPISAVNWVTGTGTWQKIAFAFTPRYAVTNARLDIENLPEGVKFNFRNASLMAASSVPSGAWIADLPLLPAHHPNRGHDVSRPNSVYAKVATDGNTVRTVIGGTGSNYLDIDSTLNLPSETTLKSGDRIRVRTAPHHLDEVTITQVEGNRLHFQPATRYQIKTGQGFFLLDELGMLDSPGEWLYDSRTGFIYAWAPDSNIPSGRIRVSILEKGVDLSGRSDIIIEGIDVRYTGLGIDLKSTKNVTLRSARISNTVREGVVANNATNVAITSNRIRQTGADAILAPRSMTIRVDENDISQSSVTVIGDLIWSLPVTTYATIYTGAAPTITGNRINTSASIGIWAEANGSVANGIIESNAVFNSCLQMNDCGAIYVNYSSPNIRIASNLIERVSGNPDGVVPSQANSHGVGIYLDDRATNIEVTNNTVAWADYGIQVHNAYFNQIHENLLHGNQNNQLWFQERTNIVASTGDIHDNKVSRNRFFPTAAAAAVKIEGAIGSLTHFGVLSANYYSALFSNRIIAESWPAHSLAYTLEEWQSAVGGDGRIPQDIGSSQLLQKGYAIYLAAGGNIVPNGGLQAGTKGWSSWNEMAPYSTIVYETCTFGPCLRATAGATPNLVHTPRFSVEAGHAYRVSFDARTDIDGLSISPLVRRAGPSPLYDRLMPASQGFAVGTDWRRYAFVFTAAKTVTAGDYTADDLGARLDFENIPLGRTLWIANMEIVPLLAVENTLRTQLITNRDRVTQSRECPDQETASDFCNHYYLFPDGTPVSWPIDLRPLEAVSIFTVNHATRDSDEDGIADSADRCPGTLKADPVNAAGCALTQIPGR